MQNVGVRELDELWGSILVSFAFDIVERHARVEVTVRDGDRDRALVLSLFGVERLEIDRTGANAWDYVEITEAHESIEGDARNVSLLLWDEHNRLSAWCDRWTLERTPPIG